MLNQVLLVKNKIAEGKIAVALAEHLFKKLAPGQDYLIDNMTKGKDCCPCGSCSTNPKAGITDIGMILFKEINTYSLPVYLMCSNKFEIKVLVYVLHEEVHLDTWTMYCTES